MVASSQKIFAQKSFFAAWRSVKDYYGTLAESGEYLRLKRQVREMHRWRLEIDYHRWHKSLLQRLVSIICSWSKQQFWESWKARWILVILVQHQRKRFLYRNGPAFPICPHPS
jgi:hypothetical protein